MNVLIVNKYFFVSGGPERYMFSAIDFLERQGHHVVPLTLALEQNQPSPYAHYFLPSPFDQRTSHYKDSALGLTEKVRLTLRSIYYGAARRRVTEIVRREKIDTVYLLNICNYISPSVIDGARQAGARVVMRLSDFNFVCASYHFFRDGQVCTACQNGMYHAIKYRCVRDSLSLSAARVLAMKIHVAMRIYQRVHAFVTPSQFMAESLIQAQIPRERVHCIPSFVDLKQYTPVYKPGRYALYFGRLDTEKGVDQLLYAWQSIGKDAPPLRIIGSGEAEADLRKLARELDVSNVEFYGFMKKEQLIEQIQGAAFIVVPSLWPDNSPMAVYEAMACGKAVIGSWLGGIPDQVEDGKTGVLIEPGNVDAVAHAVMRLWQDVNLTETLGYAARQRAETEFSPENHISRLMDVLW
jgi:glycosyltransferase involved in cell wall biosynthesis